MRMMRGLKAARAHQVNRLKLSRTTTQSFPAAISAAAWIVEPFGGIAVTGIEAGIVAHALPVLAAHREHVLAVAEELRVAARSDRAARRVAGHVLQRDVAKTDVPRRMIHVRRRRRRHRRGALVRRARVDRRAQIVERRPRATRRESDRQKPRVTHVSPLERTGLPETMADRARNRHRRDVTRHRRRRRSRRRWPASR